MSNPILTILKKQLKDTWKNKAVLLQFLMFPIMAVIMTKSVRIEGMEPNFFVSLFAAMYAGMAPLVGVSSIISEEKEKNTLRVLLMAGVRPGQYLFGIGCYVFSACMTGSAVFCALLEGTGFYGRFWFLLIMAAGIAASVLLGAVIGVGSRNQMSATSLMVPVMLVFSFLPMLSVFNKVMAEAAGYTYTEHLRILIRDLSGGADRNFMFFLKNGAEHMFAIGANMLVFGSMFFWLYKKKGLELL